MSTLTTVLIITEAAQPASLLAEPADLLPYFFFFYIEDTV